MLALFELANAEEYAANAVELEVILQKCQQEHTVGAVQVSSPVRGDLQFLLSRGEVVSIQVQNQPVGGFFEAVSWRSMLEMDGAASVRVLLLPPLALRLARILAESGEPVERKIINSSEVGSLLESWRSPLGLNMVRLGWADAEVIMLLPPLGKPIRDAVFLSGNGNFEVGQEAWDKTRARSDGECVVSLFPSRNGSQAWLDCQLHHAFVWLTELMIGRYEQFAGRVLVNALARDVGVTAERGNWDIAIRGPMMQDWIFCRTPIETASIYREVLRVIRHHLSVVLGNKRVATIIAEAMGMIPSPYHGLVQTYNLLPEAFASSGDGGQ